MSTDRLAASSFVKSEFFDRCQELGLTKEDVAVYGGGFEALDSGQPRTKAEIIAHNKNFMKNLINNPELLKKLAEVLAPFSIPIVGK